MRRIAVVLVAGCTIAACGSAASAARSSRATSPPPSSPTTQLSVSPVTSASVAVTGTPTLAPSATSSGYPDEASPLNCRLPVASPDAPAHGPSSAGTVGHGGFVTFPEGRFVVDPASERTYDAAQSRWLPVEPAQVSSDGARFAYAAQQGTGSAVHIVTVAGGSEQSIALPEAWKVVAMSTDGVYLTRRSPDGSGSGLSLLNPSSQVVAEITSDAKDWEWIGAGSAWALGWDPNSEYQGLTTTRRNSVYRLSLASGSVSEWADRAGQALSILGVDGVGDPLVGQQSANFWFIFVGPSAQERLGPDWVMNGDGSDLKPNLPVLADSHGVWLSSQSGAIWLYSPAQGLRQAASVPFASPLIAGPCR